MERLSSRLKSLPTEGGVKIPRMSKFIDTADAFIDKVRYVKAAQCDRERYNRMLMHPSRWGVRTLLAMNLAKIRSMIS